MSTFTFAKPAVPQEAREFHLVFHPFICKNEESALKSIGGLKNFARIVQDKRLLLLKLQPDNEYHAGVFSSKPKTNKTIVHLVFKFQRNKRTDAVRVKCLGIVKNHYSFSTMADFQYLPLRKIPGGNNVFDDLVPKIVPQNLTDALCWWDRPHGSEEVEHFLPPFVFSRYTKITNRLMTPEDMTFPDDTTELIAENKRAERKTFTLICHGNDDFPREPAPQTVAEADQRCRFQQPHELIRKLFERRPIWTRPAVLAETSLEDSLLKSLLPKYAFYIISGPFGRCWCRYGFDPREHPSSKAYQTIAVSFRLNEQIPERMRLKIAARNSAGNARNLDREKLDYKFIAGTLPHARQMWYCIMDIKTPVAEEVMSTDFTQIQKKYDSANGWLPPEIVEAVRESIKADVNQTMDTLRENEMEDFTEEYFDGTIEDIF